MCGNGHYSMKGIIDVVDQEEYDVWMAKQKPQYLVTFPDKDPDNVKPADTTRLAAKTIETATKLTAKL